MKNILTILLLSILFVSCKKEAKVGSIDLKISHVVGDKTFELNNKKYTSPTDHPFQIIKLVYYISEVSFIATDGTKQTFNEGFYIDVADESTFTIPFKDLKPNKYNKIEFQFGFTRANNYIDYLEQTMENQNMFWFNPVDSLAYHYMKFEGYYDSLNLGTHNFFKYHFGPTDGNDNSFRLSLNIPEFEINDNSFQAEIEMDVYEWLQNPTDYNFPDYTMVMMNQNTQLIYKANGQNVFSFKELIQDDE